MRKRKLSPAQLEEWRALAYATMLCDALWLAADAYERGDRREGRRIDRAIQSLIDVFSGPDGLPGFPAAFVAVKSEILGTPAAAQGESQPPSSRLH